MTDHADLLITSGTIVDGTGAPARPGTIWPSATAGSARSAPGDGAARARPARSTRRGKVVAPGFIDLHSPLRPHDPRRSGSRREGPPGRDDRARRRRRPELRAVPDPGRPRRDGRDERRPRRRSARRRRRARHERTRPPDRRSTGRPSRTSSPATTRARRVNVAQLVGNTPLRIAALGWDDVPADARPRPRPARASPRGDGGGRVRGQQRPRLPARRLRDDRRARRARQRGRRGSAASTTPTSATRSATASSTRSARRSRSAGAARRPPTSPTSTTGRRSRARPTRCSSSSTTRPAAGQDVTLRPLPVRVGQHPAPDPDPDLGPGGRARPGRRSAWPTRPSGIGSARDLRARGQLFAGARRPPRHP